MAEEIEAKPEEDVRRALADLTERVSDLEDVVMMEDLGLRELSKKFEKLKIPEARIPPELTKRIDTIEKKLADLPAQIPIEPVQKQLRDVTEKLEGLSSKVKKLKEVPPIPPELTQKIAKIEGQLAAIPRVDLTPISAQIQALGKSLKGLSSEVEKLKKVPSDLSLVAERADILKARIEKRMDVLERSLKLIEDRLKIPPKPVKEIEILKKGLAVATARVDAMESVVSDFTAEIKRLRPTLKRVETFEKLVDLRREVSKKLEEFETLRGGIEELTKRVERVHRAIERRAKALADVNKRLDEMEGVIPTLVAAQLKRLKIDQRLDRLSQDVQTLKDEIPKLAGELRAEVFSRSKAVDGLTAKVEGVREVMKPLVKRLELMAKQVAPLENLPRRVSDLEVGMKSVGPDIDRRVSDILKTELKGLNDRLTSHEERMKAIEAVRPAVEEKIGELKADLEKRLAGLADELKKVASEKVRLIEDRLASAEEMYKKLTQQMKKVTPEKVKQIEERIASAESEYRKGLKELKSMIEKRVRAMRVPIPITEDEVKEITDRLLFLETRLSAIEKTLSRMGAGPVIIE